MNAGPRCKLCGRRHWVYEAHAINTQEERLTHAINAPLSPPTPDQSQVLRSGPSEVSLQGVRDPQLPAVDTPQPSGVGERTPNRRRRQVYNAYMKGYMARRRAT